jgi:hypothetical protein
MILRTSTSHMFAIPEFFSPTVTLIIAVALETLSMTVETNAGHKLRHNCLGCQTRLLGCIGVSPSLRSSSLQQEI